MMIDWQFFLSTTEDEKNYFTGESAHVEQSKLRGLQAGTYRVVDGELCQIGIWGESTLNAIRNTDKSSRPH